MFFRLYRTPMTYTDTMGVFQEAIAALKAQDFARLTSLCDPVSLRSFQRSVLSQLDPYTPHSTLTVEQLMQAVPDMPKVVAEYQTAQYRREDDPAQRPRCLRSPQSSARRCMTSSPSVPSKMVREWHMYCTGSAPTGAFHKRAMKRQVLRNFQMTNKSLPASQRGLRRHKWHAASGSRMARGDCTRTTTSCLSDRLPFK
jgi:hypothetical protein